MTSADVLVIGGGPAGVATAIPLARSGARVVVVDRGDRPPSGPRLLTPPAGATLDDLGVALPSHPVTALRWTSGTDTSTAPWPLVDGRAATAVDHIALQDGLSGAASAAGVEVLATRTATAPIVERGFVRGAQVADRAGRTSPVRATVTVVADGANSRFGRSLGSYRQPDWPFAAAHATVARSPLATSTEVELVLGLADTGGVPLSAFGWMLPDGAETVGIGVMIMSTSPSFSAVKPAVILQQLVEQHAARWRLAEPVAEGRGGRIPLGGSVGPAATATTLLVGDAAGVANPWSGLGIDAALESGALAAEVVADALDGSSAALQRYPSMLRDRYGSYHHVGRLASRLVGAPVALRRLARWAARDGRIAGGIVRLTSDSLRPGGWGLAESAFRIGRALSAIAPDA